MNSDILNKLNNFNVHDRSFAAKSSKILVCYYSIESQYKKMQEIL
jgi:hypothetical protein